MKPRLRLLMGLSFILCTVGFAESSWAAEGSRNGKFLPTAQDKIVPRDAKVELLWNEGEFTEGPAPATDGAILFSDIGNRIMRYDPRAKTTTVFRATSGKANGLKFDSQGNLVACEGAAPSGNRRISVTDAAGKTRTLADRFEGKQFNSPNDLAITSGGRVYFSDPRYVGDEPRELDFEAVFLVEPTGSVRVATRDVQKPNGIIVTSDGNTVYVSDNNSLADGNHQLVRFAVQADGTLAEKKLLHDFGPNRRGIDGMTLDQQGNIYATAGSGSEAGVYVFGTGGEPLAFIATPGDPTNCVFGIGDEAATLYITAAGPKAMKTESKPRYALYRIPLTIPGYHVFPSAGDKK
jgi:sugar lactone lactonase YvrE